jgi:hypothetical protein
MRFVTPLVLAGALLGCRHPHRDATNAPTPTPDATTAATDTVRGVVEVIGNDPLSFVQLNTRARGRWRVDGALATELRAAAGLEVTLTGAPVIPTPGDAPRFVATRYAVRAADGVAAVDGVLALDGGRLVLRTSDDVLHGLSMVPAGLRDQVGARVWWAGPLDRSPVSYGILRAGR